MRVRSSLLLFALLGACTPEPPPPACEEDFVGERDAPVEIEIVHRTASGELVEASAGGDVELFRPPQGGKVFLTAARVRNVDACGLRIQASLRDPCTQRIIGLEGRPFPVRKTDDGWLEPLSESSFSSWANVPACPSQAAERRVDGQRYLLTVEVEDRAGRRATQDLEVVPRCVQPGFLGEQCRCECGPEYTLGERCEEAEMDAGPDAGAVDAGALDAGSSDAGSIDAGTIDAGITEADAGLICPGDNP